MSVTAPEPSFFVSKILAFLRGEPIFPTALDIFLTDSCDHNCCFCMTASYRQPEQHLPLDVLEGLVLELNSVSHASLTLCGGGEPLLHPKILPFLNACKDCNFPLSLITHGALINRQLLPAIIASCQEVRISLDAGDQATHAFIHGVDPAVFLRIIDNILALIAARGPSIVLSFVSNANNIESLPQFLQLAARLRVNGVSITTDINLCRCERNDIWTAVRKFISEFEAANQLYIEAHPALPDEFLPSSVFPCPIVLFSAAVTAGGDVFPSCHHVTSRQGFLGNIIESGGVIPLYTRPEVQQRLAKYAFGTADKCVKLVASDANIALNQQLLECDSFIALLEARMQ